MRRISPYPLSYFFSILFLFSFDVTFLVTKEFQSNVTLTFLFNFFVFFGSKTRRNSKKKNIFVYFLVHVYACVCVCGIRMFQISSEFLRLLRHDCQ